MSYKIIYESKPDALEISGREREIVHLLKEHDCEVTFTKKDGSERVMPCTLRQDAMPVREANTVRETKIHKPDTITVWCLDKSEWRAFKTSNVKQIRVLA